MMKILTVVYFAGVCITGYHFPFIGWLLLIPPCLLVLLVYIGALSARPSHLDELSPAANKVLRKYFPHYFLPNTFSVYSTMAILSWMSAVFFAIIGVFRNSWGGVPIAVGVFAAMQLLANRFFPTNYSRNSDEQIAHSEVVAFLKKQRTIEQHETAMRVDLIQAESGRERLLFGTKWFMSMREVRFLLPYAETSIDYDNELWHPGKINGREVAFNYHFENDSLTKISVCFQGYSFTVEDFHQVQTLLSKDYCQMSEPCPSREYALFSQGQSPTFIAEHIFSDHGENKFFEEIVFLPPSE
jgi:hypothetical protein